jgi:hypothetical protein
LFKIDVNQQSEQVDGVLQMMLTNASIALQFAQLLGWALPYCTECTAGCMQSPWFPRSYAFAAFVTLCTHNWYLVRVRGR